jgi:hypothetical protein
LTVSTYAPPAWPIWRQGIGQKDLSLQFYLGQNLLSRGDFAFLRINRHLSDDFPPFWVIDRHRRFSLGFAGWDRPAFLLPINHQQSTIGLIPALADSIFPYPLLKAFFIDDIGKQAPESAVPGHARIRQVQQFDQFRAMRLTPIRDGAGTVHATHLGQKHQGQQRWKAVAFSTRMPRIQQIIKNGDQAALIKNQTILVYRLPRIEYAILQHDLLRLGFGCSSLPILPKEINFFLFVNQLWKSHTSWNMLRLNKFHQE